MEDLHPRQRFWSDAMRVVTGSSPWPERVAALRASVERHDFGHGLVQAGDVPGYPNPGSLSPPMPESTRGYRGFLMRWDVGEDTGIHGHADTMFVYVISAELECVDYRREGDRVFETSTTRCGPRQTILGHADNGRYDNFIHALRCLRPGWTLHVYSDSGRRGVRFGADHALLCGAAHG